MGRLLSLLLVPVKNFKVTLLRLPSLSCVRSLLLQSSVHSLLHILPFASLKPLHHSSLGFVLDWHIAFSSPCAFSQRSAHSLFCKPLSLRRLIALTSWTITSMLFRMLKPCLTTIQIVPIPLTHLLHLIGGPFQPIPFFWINSPMAILPIMTSSNRHSKATTEKRNCAMVAISRA